MRLQRTPDDGSVLPTGFSTGQPWAGLIQFCSTSESGKLSVDLYGLLLLPLTQPQAQTVWQQHGWAIDWAAERILALGDQ